MLNTALLCICAVATSQFLGVASRSDNGNFLDDKWLTGHWDKFRDCIVTVWRLSRCGNNQLICAWAQFWALVMRREVDYRYFQPRLGCLGSMGTPMGRSVNGDEQTNVCSDVELREVVNRLRDWFKVLHDNGNQNKKTRIIQRPERSPLHSSRVRRWEVTTGCRRRSLSAGDLLLGAVRQLEECAPSTVRTNCTERGVHQVSLAPSTVHTGNAICTACTERLALERYVHRVHRAPCAPGIVPTGALWAQSTECTGVLYVARLSSPSTLYFLSCIYSIIYALGFDTSILPICKDSLGWMFNRLDTNYDLLLDQSELGSLYLDKNEHCTKSFFNSCDTYRDGLISNNEWCYCFQRQQGFDTSILPICKDSLGWMFNRLDTNYDLLLDQSELGSLYLDKNEHCTKSFFNSCDTYRDGLISNNEWCYCFQRQQDPPCQTELTNIQKQQAGKKLLGLYIPSCDEDGYYKPNQCHGSVGQCWCVDRYGNEVTGSKTHGDADCGTA
ncbi:UNVERIFIED_CONTAM: hypothetical protein FKN15_005668 [Acipenser sinensis]